MTAGTLAPLAAKHGTSTIPIVTASAGDPLGSGLVASLARPVGNVTGISLMLPDREWYSRGAFSAARAFERRGELMLAEELMLLKSGSLDIARPLNRLGKSNEVPFLQAWVQVD